jgi:hypothetical protein
MTVIRPPLASVADRLERISREVHRLPQKQRSLNERRMAKVIADELLRRVRYSQS